MATRCSSTTPTSRVRGSGVCATGPRSNSRSNERIAALEPEMSRGSTAIPPRTGLRTRPPRLHQTRAVVEANRGDPGRERAGGVGQIRGTPGNPGNPQALPRSFRRSPSRSGSDSHRASPSCADEHPPAIRRRGARGRQASLKLAIDPITYYFERLRRTQTCETWCRARVAFLKG